MGQRIFSRSPGVRAAVAFGGCALALASCSGTTSTGRPDAVPVQLPAMSTLSAPAPAQLVVHSGTDHAAQPQEGPIWHRVHSMTLLNRVRQMMVLPFAGTGVPRHLIDALHPGGIIYFANNLTSQQQTKTLSNGIQAEAGRVTYPMLLMTDQEGKPVTRIPGTENTPGGIMFHGNATWARNTALRTGRLMSGLLVNTDLAPDSDVNTAGGPIDGRSFGSNPGVVSRLVTAQICGYHQGGVATSAKHFPGLGSTTENTEEHPATIHETVAKWRSTDLPPFQAAVKNHVDMILVGHVAFPALDPSGRPASISSKLNRDLIRDELHYTGVVISDALGMGGVTPFGTNAQIAIWAVQAGDDMLLMPPQPVVAIQAIYHAVLNGQISEGRIDMAVFRVLKLKQTLGLFDQGKHLAQCGS